MKKIKIPLIVFAFLLLTPKESVSQELILGAGGTKTIASKNYRATGGGLNVYAEYNTEKIYSYRFHVNLLTEDTSPGSSFGTTDLVTSLNFSILFSPPYKMVQTFAGVGAGYYFHNTEQPGNSSVKVNGVNISNNVGLTFTGGIRFPATGFMTLMLQLRYVLQYSKITAAYDDFETGRPYKIETGSLNLGGLFLDANIAFRLWRY